MGVKINEHKMFQENFNFIFQFFFEWSNNWNLHNRLSISLQRQHSPFQSLRHSFRVYFYHHTFMLTQYFYNLVFEKFLSLGLKIVTNRLRLLGCSGIGWGHKNWTNNIFFKPIFHFFLRTLFEFFYNYNLQLCFSYKLLI